MRKNDIIKLGNFGYNLLGVALFGYIKGYYFWELIVEAMLKLKL